MASINWFKAMLDIDEIKRPTKEEQEVALASYKSLAATLEGLRSKNAEIEIKVAGKKIRIPLSALKLLVKILKVTSQGKPISIVPLAAEMTTQSAAEALGCSRPHVIKLLESGAIPFTKVGRHRRIKFEDIITYKSKMKAERRNLLIKMMREDENDGLYDS
jgi:excisionase family DNA binding protein